MLLKIFLFALQVEYHEFLWLQLQAFHAGRTLEEQDNYLEEARRDIDKILDEVINYKFDSTRENTHCEVGMKATSHATSSKDTICATDKDNTCGGDSDNDINAEDVEEDGEYLSFKTSFDKDTLTSSPRAENARFANSEEVSQIKENLPSIEKLDLSDESPPCPVNSKIEDDEKIFDLNGTRNGKIMAMYEVSALIQKVESIEKLYPNTKALTNAHPKYKDIRFVNSIEALLLWLYINKDLYHQLDALADWIEIEPDDVLNWRDWFDCGLGKKIYIDINKNL